MLALVMLGGLAAGCRRASKEDTGYKPPPRREFSPQRLTQSLGAPEAKAAWALQTALHGEFIRRYDRASAAEQEALRDELEKVYFIANPILCEKFEQAIASDPTEPANYISYGYYLLPRQDKFEDALGHIEKGITMEEDNPAWHFLLAYAYVGPFRSGDFTIFGYSDRVRWVRYKDKYFTVIRRTQNMWPDNWFVPYFHAVQLYKTSRDEQKAWEAVLQGNRMQKGHFVFVPPLPVTMESWLAAPDRDDYFDLQWQFGLYTYTIVEDLVEKLLEADWVRTDPEALWELLVFLHQVSATRPMDRLYVSHTGLVLEQLEECLRDKGETATARKLADARQFQREIADTLKQEFALSRLPLTGSTGPQDTELVRIERSCRRQEQILEPVLRLQVRLLTQVREALGLSPEEHPIVTPKWELQ